MQYVNDAFCSTVGIDRETVIEQSLKTLSALDALVELSGVGTDVSLAERDGGVTGIVLRADFPAAPDLRRGKRSRLSRGSRP